jgi:hypothetical protein
MKSLHRPDLYAWSTFDEARNLDFHSLLWVRSEGNVVVDPLPLTPHDRRHLDALGGVAWIVVTNSDHLRTAVALASETGAKIAGPVGERDVFPADRWLSEGDELVLGLFAYEMRGSKTPGELALVLEGDTLITGDLVRAHRAGSLCLLPDAKLTDKAAALASVARLAALPVRAVLVGDGYQVFAEGQAHLSALVPPS